MSIGKLASIGTVGLLLVVLLMGCGTKSITQPSSPPAGTQIPQNPASTSSPSAMAQPTGSAATTPVTVDVSSKVNTNGMFTTGVTLSSADSKATVNIPSGTVATTITATDQHPMKQLSVAVVPTTQPLAYQVAPTYDFGPDGTIFDSPATLTLSYDPALIPSKINEQDLTVAYWENYLNMWLVVGGVVDTVKRTITVQVEHFSEYTVYGVDKNVESPLMVSPVSAVFVSAARETDYSTTAIDLTGAPTYKWRLLPPFNDPDCSSFKDSGDSAVWHHSDTDGCDHTKEDTKIGHTGMIAVGIADGPWFAMATYRGTNSGDGGDPFYMYRPPDGSKPAIVKGQTPSATH